MNDTQRLLAIALAVLALDGCRSPATHAQAPGATPTPGSRSGSGNHVYRGGGTFGASAAGAVLGGALRRNGSSNNDRPNQGGYTRTLGGNRNAGASAANSGGSRGGFFSHFGGSGFHGGG